MNVYGHLIRAQLEPRTSDYAGTITGIVWFDKTNSRVKFADGTIVKAVLANDDKAVFGTDGTASNNIRFHRSKAETLQIVPGDDVTAEGSNATSIGQIAARAVNHTNATRPAVGNTGAIIYNTDAGRFEGDSGVAWDPLGSGGGGFKVESAEHDCQARHYGVQTGTADNAICAAFDQPAIAVEGFLLEDIGAASTDMTVAWNPVFLDDSDRDSLFQAGYLAVSGTSAGSIVSTATTKLGASATQFSKTSGTALAFIQHDVGAANAISLAANGFAFAYVNLSTASNVDDVSIRLTDLGDNPAAYSEYAATTQHDGSAIAAGWGLYSWNLWDTTIKTDTSTGWSPDSNLLRTFAWGVNTATTTQTLDLIIDSLCFEAHAGQSVRPTYELLGQLGNEYDIIDNTNKQAVILDSASARVHGNVTLDTGPASAVTGGTASVVVRNSLGITGNNKAEYTSATPFLGVDLSSGASELTGTVRFKKNLKDTLSAATITQSVIYDTPLRFDVTDGAATATTVECEDLADQSAELLSGDVMVIVNVLENDGSVDYRVSANTFTLTANSSWSADVLTLTASSGDVSNVSTGDILVKDEELEVFLSTVTGATTDESFGSALTRSEMVLNDIGLPYPQQSAIVADIRLGSVSEADAFKNQVSSLVTAPSKVGTPDSDLAFDPGRSALQLAFGNIGSASDHLVFDAASTDELDPDNTEQNIMSYSFWAKFGSVAANEVIMGHHNGAATGFAISKNATLIQITANASNDTHSQALSADTWYHIAVAFEDGISTRVWINGVGEDLSVLSTSTSTPWYIGRFGDGSAPATSMTLARFTAWQGVKVTDAEVKSIYNGGLFREFGSTAGFIQRFVSQSQSGDKISGKVNLIRETNAVSPFLTTFVTVETS